MRSYIPTYYTTEVDHRTNNWNQHKIPQDRTTSFLKSDHTSSVVSWLRFWKNFLSQKRFPFFFSQLAFPFVLFNMRREYSPGRLPIRIARFISSPWLWHFFLHIFSCVINFFTNIYNARAQSLFCSLNLFFRDVAVAVVVFLKNSLFFLDIVWMCQEV